MKKYYPFYFLSLALICFIAFTQMACNDKKEHDGMDDPSCVKPLNPNGDSELAVLMREMVKASEANAEALRNGANVISYPVSYQQIMTATPSDSTLDMQMFYGYAKGYLHAIDEFNKSDISNRITTHNNVVQSCKSCHEQFCRGPIKRIVKMTVN